MKEHLVTKYFFFLTRRKCLHLYPFNALAWVRISRGAPPSRRPHSPPKLKRMRW